MLLFTKLASKNLMVISTLFFHLYLFVLSDHEQNHKLPPPY